MNHSLTSRGSRVVSAVVDRYTTAFLLASLALIAISGYTIRDVYSGLNKIRQMHTGSVHGLDLIGEMQYQIQEARRSMLYALATTDPNQQVKYVDQSRASDAFVAALFDDGRRMSLSTGTAATLGRLEFSWASYLTNRDEVIAAILEGDPRAGVKIDIETGVPAFSKVRDLSQVLRKHFNDEAARQLIEAQTVFRLSLVRFAVSLFLTLAFTLAAVRSVERGKLLGTVQVSEKRLKEFVRSINEGMLVVLRDDTIDLWNQAAVRSTGWQVDSMVGKSLAEAYNESTAGALKDVIQHARDSGVATTLNDLPLLGESSNRRFEVRIFPFDRGTTIFFADVSERSLVTHQLKLAKESLAASSRAKDELIAAMGKEIESLSEGVGSIARATLSGQSLNDDPRERERLHLQAESVLEVVRRLSASLSDWVEGFRGASGMPEGCVPSQLDAEIRGVPGSNAKTVSATRPSIPIVAGNLSPHHGPAEDPLGFREAHGDWQFSVDAAGLVKEWSLNSERMTGFPLAGFVAGERLLEELVFDEDRARWKEGWTGSLSLHFPTTVEFRIRHASGDVRWVEQIGHPVRDETGAVVGRRVVWREISHQEKAGLQKQKEVEDIAHLARVATTGELAASIAHELNQPLTAILANAQAAQRLLKRNPPDVAEVRDAVGDIILDSQRAGEVIRRLRSLFKRSHLERGQININSLVWDTVHLLRTELQMRDVLTRMDLSAGLPSVSGDRVQLQQVILNLLINAMDAMDSLPPQQRLVEIVSDREETCHVRISIRDTGAGISDELILKIFSPFFTTKKGGMGMGLSVARSIIEEHGGRLWATNHANGGASFHFVVPFAAT